MDNGDRGPDPKPSAPRSTGGDPVRDPGDGYYRARDLGRFHEIGQEAPELAEAFFAWYGAVFQEGALSMREKALIALAVAHALQCPYCIDAYTESCLEAGSNGEQMTEAIHVAAALRGGASLVHGVQMRNHLGRMGMS